MRVGVSYRERVEIEQETEAEGEAMLAEMEGWRQRGKDLVRARVVKMIKDGGAVQAETYGVPEYFAVWVSPISCLSSSNSLFCSS
jgi:hypothetical protein